MPKEVIGRYVIAKWNAQQAGKEAYKALKGEWKSMINLLIDKGTRGMDGEMLAKLLVSIANRNPKFLSSDAIKN